MQNLEGFSLEILTEFRCYQGINPNEVSPHNKKKNQAAIVRGLMFDYPSEALKLLTSGRLTDDSLVELMTITFDVSHAEAEAAQLIDLIKAAGSSVPQPILDFVTNLQRVSLMANSGGIVLNERTLTFKNF